MNAKTTLLSPPTFLKLLGHDVRWQLLETLASSDQRVQELVKQLGRPQNLISYHLRQLRDAEIVSERRSSYDARDVYYTVDLERLQVLFSDTEEALHPALGKVEPARVTAANGGSGRPARRVIFLCTHNSARSQMAEGILRSMGGNLVEVVSAGSEPTSVHPLAMRAMEAMKIDISGHRSKSMDPFVDQHFDYIITVCDRVRESCPVFPDDPERIHWSFEDPAAIEGTEEERYAAFEQTARELMTRISFLLLVIKRNGKGT